MLKSLFNSLAASDLGLGGALQDQVNDETDEQKQKRLQMKQMQTALTGRAGTDLLGGFTGRGGFGALAY